LIIDRFHYCHFDVFRRYLRFSLRRYCAAGYARAAAIRQRLMPLFTPFSFLPLSFAITPRLRCHYCRRRIFFAMFRHDTLAAAAAVPLSHATTPFAAADVSFPACCDATPLSFAFAATPPARHDAVRQRR
jgi:hypothetical protein